jgi:hypothetical protein
VVTSNNQLIMAIALQSYYGWDSKPNAGWKPPKFKNIPLQPGYGPKRMAYIAPHLYFCILQNITFWRTYCIDPCACNASKKIGHCLWRIPVSLPLLVTPHC